MKIRDLLEDARSCLSDMMCDYEPDAFDYKIAEGIVERINKVLEKNPRKR
jgi:hypothetical protein